MKVPEAYRRAATRYQQLAPMVGLIGTLWGIHISFRRLHTGAAPMELWIPTTDLVEALGVTVLAGLVVFLGFLVVERNR